VSLSDPRIHSFPGLEWSRTPGAAVRYMHARLCPDDWTRGLRRNYGKYQSIGSDASWVRLSQSRRIVRWLMGERARVDTMANVRAALGLDQAAACRADELSADTRS